jgi:hypothetical protein
MKFAGRWEYSSNYTYVPAGPAVLAGYSDGLGAKGGHYLLYNLATDEIESTNLASQPAQAERVKNMSARIMQMHGKGSDFMRAQRNEPHPGGNPKRLNWTWFPYEK